MIDKATGLEVSYATITDFTSGALEIYQTDPNFTGSTVDLEWLVSLDDGTIDKSMISFKVIFNSLTDCSQTSLRQGWPWEPTLTQRMRETDIQYRDLV